MTPRHEADPNRRSLQDQPQAGTLPFTALAVAFSVYYWLLRRSTVLRLSMITYTAPVVAVAVGAALFGERLGWPALAGAGLVLGGVWLTVAVRHAGR